MYCIIYLYSCSICLIYYVEFNLIKFYGLDLSYNMNFKSVKTLQEVMYRIGNTKTSRNILRIDPQKFFKVI